MRIVLDQDQVLAKWVERILEWYNQDYKTNFSREDVKTYWSMDGLLGTQGRDFLRSCMRYPELYRDLDPVEGALDGVRRLIDMGHDVVIATAIPSCAGIAYHGKLEWIRRNMPFFDLKNFIAIQRKDLVDGDLLLDDGPHNIDAWSHNHPEKTTVVFDCPWNQGVKATHRVKSWKEFLDLVEKLDPPIPF